MITADTLSGLARMSARIGADRLLVQGPGGNSSIKEGDELWVKASGQWLAEAEQKPIFVPLSIDRLQGGAGGPAENAASAAVIAERNPAGLKPSIETMLHAIMPHRVVVHAHAVNAMAISVQAEGEVRAVERLAGLAWHWIAYQRPGAPLAETVSAALARRPADVLLLQNHGVVVGAQDFDATERLLADVEKRLAGVVRNPPGPPAPDIETDDDFERHDLLSTWARDPVSSDLLTRFTLVPDQIVFLGGPIPLWLPGEQPSAAARRARRETGVDPAVLLRPGVGAVAARSRTAATEAMLVGLIEIARRVPEATAINGLSAADVTAIRGWDAEHYRQSIDAARA